MSGGTPSAPAARKPSAVATSHSSSRRIRTAVYFLHDGKVSAVPRTVTAPATATAAIRALLSGPSRFEGHRGRTTAVPSGTELRSVDVQGRLATVDLSDRFLDGGGSPSMRARVAQVVFTLTRFPTVRKVAVEIEGKPVRCFGPGGIALDRPVGRADFEDLSPAVLVESPLIGDAVRTPLRVWGSADTFEAEFRLRLTDVVDAHDQGQSGGHAPAQPARVEP